MSAVCGHRKERRLCWDCYSRRRRSPDRFWEKVQKSDGCWLWTAHRSVRGYGIFRYEYAHRFSYRMNVGPIPEGMHVCHRCDTPLCVRHDHLFLGTRADNFADMRQKGRHARGEKVSSRLKEHDVIAIRREFAAGARQLAIARRYDISPVTVHQIVHRKTWGHVA